MIDWLKAEVKVAEQHLADLEGGGAVTKSDGKNVTQEWIAEYKRRLDGLERLIANLGVRGD